MGSVCDWLLSQSEATRGAQQPIRWSARGSRRACTRSGARMDRVVSVDPQKHSKYSLAQFYPRRNPCANKWTLPVRLRHSGGWWDLLESPVATAARPSFQVFFYCCCLSIEFLSGLNNKLHASKLKEEITGSESLICKRKYWINKSQNPDSSKSEKLNLSTFLENVSNLLETHVFLFIYFEIYRHYF